MDFNISAISVRCVRQLLGPLFLIGSENAPANCHRPTPVLCLCPRSSIPLCLCLLLSPSPRSRSSISSGSMAPSHLAWSTSCGGGGASPSPPLQHQTGPRWRSGGGAVHARLRQWMSSARGPAMVEQCARRPIPPTATVVPQFHRGTSCISFLLVPRCCITCCLCLYSIWFRDCVLIWSSIGWNHILRREQGWRFLPVRLGSSWKCIRLYKVRVWFDELLYALASCKSVWSIYSSCAQGIFHPMAFA